ncbi:MAG: hypothetical protein J5630_04525 [Bacteroidaceae bacterium]|nr:hypothetical protein [Bacteroidaceae bacterium]
MKTKLFTLLTMLLLGIGSMWADDITVTISNKTDLNTITNKTQSEAATVHKYGTYSNSNSATPPLYTTFTTNDDSSLKDVIISSTANIFKPTYYDGAKYKHCFAIYPESGSSDAQTITLTAPTGYYIKGYSMTFITTGNAGHFTITPLGGSATTTVNPGNTNGQTITVSSLNANTATFTVARTESTKSATTELCLSSFTITLAAVPTYDNVTYRSSSILYSTGTFSRTDGQSSVNSNDTWESSTLSGLRYTCSRNSMGKATVSSIDYTCFHSGYSPTYTITAPDGYLIAGYSMSVFGQTGQYLQSTDYGKVALSTNSSSPTSIYVTGINAKTASMQRFGESNGWGYITSFTVYLIPLVTYTIVDGTATVFGGSVLQSNGSAPNLSNSKSTYKSSIVSEYPSYSNGYCTYSYYSDEDCTTPISTITVTAETGPCTVYAKVVSTTAPVEFASSVDDADAQWYTLKLRDYQFYASGETTVALSESDKTSSDAQWVFTGSVCNAYVYNKSAGKYLVMSDGVCALSDTPQPWIIYPHQVEGFYLYYASNYKFPYRNSSGNLAYSDGPFNESANAASFMPTGIKTNYKEDVIANVQPFFTTGVGSYFGLKTTVKETYEDDVTAATTACDAEEYSELLAVVSNPSNFVYPESGYYRIKNYSTADYLGKTGSAPTIEFANTDAASVLYLTRSGDEGSYKYTVKMQGAQYINTGKSGATGNYSLAIVAPGRFTMNDCNNAVFGYLYASGTTLSQDDIKGDASYWTLEDATSFSAAITNANDNTGTGHSYATLCVPFAISSITGASAYAPSIDENSLDLGDALSTPITAGTPIMLVGATDAGTYTANIKTDAPPVSSPATTNALTGTFTGTSIDCTAATGTNYVLGFDRENENRIGFYHVNSSSYNLKANRAYLNLSAGGEARGFYINYDDVVTGISSMDNVRWTMDDESVDIYNLSGQRMNKMQKGINIVNGKKVLF